jgi:hypothetical protein
VEVPKHIADGSVIERDEPRFITELNRFSVGPHNCFIAAQSENRSRNIICVRRDRFLRVRDDEHIMKQRQIYAKLVLVAIAVLSVGCSSSDATDTSTAAPTTIAATTSPATTVAPAPITTLSPTAGLPPGVPGDLPNGVYRVETTDADLEAVNVPEDSWAEGHGTYTWTLQDGSWSFLQTASNPIQFPTAEGVYVVDGDHVTFLIAHDFGPQEFTWSVDADGSLVLTALPSTDNFFAAMLAAHPLVLVP